MSDVSRRAVLRTAVGAIGAAVGAALVAPGVGAAGIAGHLSNDDIIRAWKDEEFGSSLTDEQRAQLPEHPSGAIETSDLDLDQARRAGDRTFSQGCYGKTCKERVCCRYSCR